MMKKALLTLSGLAVLLAGGVFGGQAWLKGRLQKDSLVAQMEDAWNCRAHLDDASVSLFSMPATVKLTGLKLAPRDAEVAKPLESRTVLAPDAAQVTAGEVVCSVQLADLLRGTVNIERLHIDGLNVRNLVDAEGKGSLDALFESPYEESTPALDALTPVTGSGGSDAPGVSADAPAAPKVPKPKKAPKPERSAMKASDLRVDLAVKSASITNGHFESTDLKGGTHTTVGQIQFALTDIDVSPGDLANHNRCQFSLDASLRVEKNEPKTQIADFVVSGSGTLEPFDAKTGEWRPDTDLTVTLRKGGLLGGAPLEKQIGKKDLEKLTEYGIKLGDIAIGGVLQNDATVQIHALPGGKMIVKRDATLTFPQYEISIIEKSWFNAPQDLHNARAKLTIGPELTARILDDSEKAVEKKVGSGFLAKAAVALVRGTLVDEQKRLVLPFKGKGQMSKPAVDMDLDAALKGVQDLLKDQGTNLLKGLFQVEEKPPAPPAPAPPADPNQAK